MSSSQGNRKEARIPEPWKLQLLLPGEQMHGDRRVKCQSRSSFLRMDVTRHTRISDIM